MGQPTRERKRAWYHANREAQLARNKVRYHANIAEVRIKKAADARRRRAEIKQDPEKYAKYLEDRKRWYSNTVTPERRRKYNLKSSYGITPEDKEVLLKEQDGKCAVCAVALPDLIKAHVDHDHDTGKVRGILCIGCNLALGHIKDDPNRLIVLASYLMCNQKRK